jgi:hypothetical protein
MDRLIVLPGEGRLDTLLRIAEVKFDWHRGVGLADRTPEWIETNRKFFASLY